MCGITGLIERTTDLTASRQTLSAMNDCVRHRGPDDAGLWDVVRPSDHYIGLAQRRLSIIDLSPAGHQPMSNEDGTVWITYNGEIYNFRELRASLKQEHQFRSNSDTEVILHLYEELGAACIERLNGIFAIAIYDMRPEAGSAGKLLLARDHVGTKPLYYARRGGRLLFASEIKSILSGLGQTPDLNHQALSDFFTYTFIPHPQTIFTGIEQLPPGTLAHIDIANGTFQIEPFWDLLGEARTVQAEWAGASAETLQTELRRKLQSAVSAQMVSDVPIGAFLSGGVDSNVVVGLMAEASDRPIQTFTAIFNGKDTQFYNEQEGARAVADKFGTDHHELEIDISRPSDLFSMVRAYDQPVGSPASYLSFLISRAAKQHVTVALSGNGGDELFAGYPRYRVLRAARTVSRIPRRVTSIAARSLDLLRTNYQTPRMRRIKQFVKGIDPNWQMQYLNWAYYLTAAEKARLLREPDLADHAVYKLQQHFHASADLPFENRFLYTDIKTFLADNILEYTDRTSMQVALEVRVPLLDPRVVEFALGLPFDVKLNGRRDKAILRDACADLIPDRNRNTPKKGFYPPLAHWMRTSLDSYFDTHLDRDWVGRVGIFNHDAIQALRARHKRGKQDLSKELFSIIMFDVWWREYMG